jgi:hypothetical protein
MSSQQRLDSSTNTVANELLLLRKLASLRRSASWQLTIERSRKAVTPLPSPAEAGGPGLPAHAARRAAASKRPTSSIALMRPRASQRGRRSGSA